MTTNRKAASVATLCLLILSAGEASAQAHPWYPATGGDISEPVHEAHIFAKGGGLAFPGDPRLDLPGGEGTIEFWFRRGWDDLARKNEYVCVIANGRSMVSGDEADPQLSYRTRYAVYLNEEVIAVQVGDSLKTFSLFGAGVDNEITGDVAQPFVHVALLFRDDTVQPVVGGRPLPLVTGMRLGDVYGSEVTVGSIGAGQGLFRSDGERLKPVEEEVHDFVGELARLRVWSVADSERYFTPSKQGAGILTTLPDEFVSRGVAIPELPEEDSGTYALSDLVGRSDFRGGPRTHRMVLGSPVFGMWRVEDFENPARAPVPPGLDFALGDIAAAPLFVIVPTAEENVGLLYLNGRHVGVLRLDEGLTTGTFSPAGGQEAEFAPASVRLFKDGEDHIELSFEEDRGHEAFARPDSKPTKRIRLVRPDAWSRRGEQIDASNEYIKDMLATFTQVAARSYDVLTMNPVDLGAGQTGTERFVFAEPTGSDWTWNVGGHGVAAPRWYHVLDVEKAMVDWTHDVATTAREFRVARSARVGATVGVPGRVGVAVDLTEDEETSTEERRTRAVTLAMGFGTSHALVVDKAQVPLSQDFLRDVRSLRDEDRAQAQPWQDFIESWGTHYALGVTYGQLMISTTTLSEDDVKTATKYGFDISAETRASGSADGGQTETWGPRGGFGSKSERVWSEIFTSEKKKLVTYPAGGLSADPNMASLPPEDTVPIFLDLRPLHELLSPAYFDDSVIYHDVRERLRQVIMLYMREEGGRSADVEKKDAERWASGELPRQRPDRATVHLRPVSLKAEGVGETDDVGEFFGKLTVKPIALNMSEGCGKDEDGKTLSACALEYKGPDPNSPATPPTVWWQADAGEALRDNVEVPWKDLVSAHGTEERVYEVLYPQYDEAGAPESDIQLLAIDDLAFVFDWSAYEESPASRDQLWGYWQDGKNDQEFQYVHTEGHYGSNWTFVEEHRHEEEGEGIARWTVGAWDLRAPYDDYHHGTEDDPSLVWGGNPPKATRDNPRTLRLVMAERPGTSGSPEAQGGAIGAAIGMIGGPPGVLLGASVGAAVGSAEKGAIREFVRGKDQCLVLTVEAWIEEHSAPVGLSEQEQKIAQYMTTVHEARPKPSPKPVERVERAIPGLVGFYPLDRDGRDVSGRAMDLATPIPPERRFDGGVLIGDPYLGAQGTFRELPFFDPTFVVPDITDGNFTVRMSFRARSPKGTGVGQAELPSLPLLVRGDGEFVLTNAALTLNSASYSEALAGGPDRSNALAFDGWPRSPVWATVTVAVDVEKKIVRHRFDVTMPTYLDLLPPRQRSGFFEGRMARDFDPGTSTEWRLSASTPDGRWQYGADAVDEIMFFDYALTEKEMAALPTRSAPGTADRAEEAATHVANMYAHAARLPELNVGRISQAEWGAIAEEVRKLFVPSQGWVMDGICVRDRNENGTMELRDFESMESNYDEMRTLAEKAGASPDHGRRISKTGGTEKVIEDYKFSQETWEASASAKVNAYVGPAGPVFRFADRGVPDVNANGQIDLPEIESFPEKGVAWLLGQFKLTPQNREPFLQMARMTFWHDLEHAVLSADFDGDGRLSAEESKVLADALERNWSDLGIDGPMPALPDLEGAPVTTGWKPANESAQKRIGDWLVGCLAPEGVRPASIPGGVGRS